MTLYSLAINHHIRHYSFDTFQPLLKEIEKGWNETVGNNQYTVKTCAVGCDLLAYSPQITLESIHAENTIEEFLQRVGVINIFLVGTDTSDPDQKWKELFFATITDETIKLLVPSTKKN